MVRYATTLIAQKTPKFVVFAYAVSQAGPYNIEQMHRVYRSGLSVRDETLALDGRALKPADRIVRIARYRDRYALASLAPRLADYTLRFESAKRTGDRFTYGFRAIPTVGGLTYAVDSVAIDGKTFLPSNIRFHLTGRAAKAAGTARFGRFGRYWMPVEVSVTAKISGKPARERIAFSGYQFPESLPKSTFRAPKPLPTPASPTL